MPSVQCNRGVTVLLRPVKKCLVRAVIGHESARMSLDLPRKNPDDERVHNKISVHFLFLSFLNV